MRGQLPVPVVGRGDRTRRAPRWERTLDHVAAAEFTGVRVTVWTQGRYSAVTQCEARRGEARGERSPHASTLQGVSGVIGHAWPSVCFSWEGTPACPAGGVGWGVMEILGTAAGWIPEGAGGRGRTGWTWLTRLSRVQGSCPLRRARRQLQGNAHGPMSGDAPAGVDL